MSVMGTRVQRREDPALPDRGEPYVADLRRPAARRRRCTCTSCARRWPTPASPRSTSPRPPRRPAWSPCSPAPTRRPPTTSALGVAIPGMIPDGLARPWLATDTVRFVGEPVAVIVTETRPQGEDAAELVIVDYDPLAVVVDPVEAEKGEVLLFPEARHERRPRGAVRPHRRRALRRLRGRRRPHASSTSASPRARSRPRGSPRPGHDGRLVACGRPPRRRTASRASSPASTASSPSRSASSPPTSAAASAPRSTLQSDEALLPLARPSPRPAGALGRDPRREHGRDAATVAARCQTVEIGGSRDGTVEAYRLTVLQDAGAYPSMGAFLPVHDPDDGAGHLRHPEGRVQRQGGRHQHHARSRPTAAPGGPRPPPPSSGPSTCSPPRSAWTRSRCAAEPHRRRTRSRSPRPPAPTYDIGDYAEALDLALEAAGYDELRAEQAAPARRRRPGAARHRRVDLRRDHRRPRRPERVRQGRGARATARVTVYTGIVAARAGPRHRVGHARQRRAPASRWSRSTSSHGDTDRRRRGRTAPSARARCSSAAPPCCDRHRAGRREGPPGRRRRCSRPTRPTSCSTPAGARSTSPARPSVAKTWAEVGAAATSPARSARPRRLPIEALDFAGEQRHVPVRRPRRRRRGRHRDRPGHPPAPHRRRRRRRPHPQPAARRRPAARRHRPGRRPGAARGGPLRRGRQPADRQPRRLRVRRRRPSCPASSWCRMETPTPVQPARRQGHRRVGHASASTPAVQNAVVDALAHLGVRHLDMPLTAEKVWRAIAGL